MAMAVKPRMTDQSATRMVVAHLAEKCCHRWRTLAAVADAEPDRDAVADGSADGEGHMNFLRDICTAPATRTKGQSGIGGGRIAGSETARMAWRSIQLVTRVRMRAGTCFSRNLRPPAWPAAWEREAAERRAQRWRWRPAARVGFGGGEDDQHDVRDAGDGQWDEGAVDDETRKRPTRPRWKKKCSERCVVRRRWARERAGGARAWPARGRCVGESLRGDMSRGEKEVAVCLLREGRHW